MSNHTPTGAPSLFAPAQFHRAEDRTIYAGELVRISLFRCRPNDELFRTDRVSSGYHLVFPRSSVAITHPGHSPVVTTPNIVMFYNQGQTYAREKVSEQGDLCDYLSYPLHVLQACLADYEPEVVERPDRPFSLTHGPCRSTTYLAQRLLVKQVLAGKPFDRLHLEETALDLLEQVVAHTWAHRPKRHVRSETAQSRRALVAEAQALLATRFRESLTLVDIASALYCSPYHLSRIFKRETGETIHGYRSRLRMHAALEYVLDSGADLADVAVELGFASHSHFTQAFRKAFGFTPSGLRDQDARTRQRTVRLALGVAA